MDISRAGSHVGRAEQQRETVLRQGRVVSVQAGPPRSVTVDLAGTNYTGIRIMDHVTPVVGQGLWLADIGMGRWLGIGTSAS